MVKVLFVCLGNICRSPMAEFVFKDIVNKKGLSKDFFIDSAATSSEAVRRWNILWNKRYIKRARYSIYRAYIKKNDKRRLQ